MNFFFFRVSFGSSKGSMVETLVFETPTPLPEHAEREFTFSPEVQQSQLHPNQHLQTSSLISSNKQMPLNGLNSSSYLDDSGIEMQEE